ncbi:Uncharacterised protein [Mycobacterium tuberculosis]|nr:Uncharacterised protein [Mycobacterium tuberculosis]CNW17472.1 Uncharacterised protein [Mycobacterium tuberculosis]
MNTSLAASGSTRMFHSVIGWPSNMPPMITSRRSSLGSAGSARSASARLVSGPVTRPIRSPAWECAAAIQAVVAS